MRIWGLLVAMLAWAPMAWAQEDPLFPFNLPEPVVTPSPAGALAVGLPGLRAVVTMAVAPTSSETALVGVDEKGAARLVLWDLRAPPRVLAVPAGMVINSLAWHPVTRTLFAAGKVGGGYAVMRLDVSGGTVGAKVIWAGGRPVDHVLVGPRPFKIVTYGPPTTGPNSAATYRLFFDEHEANGEDWARAVGEHGESPYVVAGESAKLITADEAMDDEGPPPALTINVKKILAFSPGGDQLYVQSDNKCIYVFGYSGRLGWEIGNEEAQPCDGDSVEISPNGLLELEWLPEQAGLTLKNLQDGSVTNIELGVSYALHPRFAADGGGLIGVLPQGGGFVLRYQPEAMPFADVTNVWAFPNLNHVSGWLTKNGGYFSPPANGLNEIFDFYDTENTGCGGQPDFTAPIRPYLLTTDVMWELYAGAYAGIFGLVERHQAIPAFVKMVDLGAADMGAKHPGSRLALMFAAAQAVLNDDRGNPEAARVLDHGDGVDPIFPNTPSYQVTYSMFEPRGFYADTPPMARYFAAFKYLTSLRMQEQDIEALRGAPADFLAAARDWITSYQSFLAPSREPDGFVVAASHDVHPGEFTYLFPLSFGADNDVLYNTVYNRIPDRPLGSGLDVAAAFGSATALGALQAEGQFALYAGLQGALQKLQAKYAQGLLGDDPLYSLWLEALRTQWQTAPKTPISGPLWDVKRLQTGLASWATLRHATVLMNEVTGAECGGPSMEQIVMRAPHGYVEPDPATFKAIAHLFDLTLAQWNELEAGGDAAMALGVAENLAGSRDEALYYAGIAQDEIDGKTLSAKNYADIEYAGGRLGDEYKMYLSLARDDNGLMQPDPIGKIAEISGDASTGYTEAAVGNVLEWDQIIPDFGHHDIVKGGIYSYYEFAAPAPMTDSEWRGKIDSTPPPAWVGPYLAITP
jgi:hypothetical protein